MPIEALPHATARLIRSSLAVTDTVSVVKELVDNALDARATAISVELSLNGLDVIQVRDNGTGIDGQDRSMLCKRGCTSKIRTLEDMNRLGGSFLGFRGEALASIAELSSAVIVTSRVDGDTAATSAKYTTSGLLSSSVASHPVGTTVRIQDFLAAVPVRRQAAIKAGPATVQGVQALLKHFAFARSHVRLSFKVLKHKNDKATWTYAANATDSLTEVAAKILGVDVSSECVEHHISAEAAARQGHAGWALEGLLIKPNPNWGSVRNVGQFISVDGRPLRADRNNMKALTKAYKRHLRTLPTLSDNSSISQPFFVLRLQCPTESYDVNIEAAKDEVLFFEPAPLLSLVNSIFQSAYGCQCSVEDDVDGFNLSSSTSHRDSGVHDLDDIEYDLQLTESVRSRAFPASTRQNVCTTEAIDTNVESITVVGDFEEFAPLGTGRRASQRAGNDSTRRIRHSATRFGGDLSTSPLLPSPVPTEDSPATGHSPVPLMRRQPKTPIQQDAGSVVDLASGNAQRNVSSRHPCFQSWLTPVSSSKAADLEDQSALSIRNDSCDARGLRMPNRLWAGTSQNPFEPPSAHHSQWTFPDLSDRAQSKSAVRSTGSTSFRSQGFASSYDLDEESPFPSSIAASGTTGGIAEGAVPKVAQSGHELHEIMDFEHRKKAAIAQQKKFVAKRSGVRIRDLLKTQAQRTNSETAEEEVQFPSATPSDEVDATMGTNPHTVQPPLNRSPSSVTSPSHGPRAREVQLTGFRTEASWRAREPHANGEEPPEFLHDDVRSHWMEIRGNDFRRRTMSSKLPLEKIPRESTTLSMRLSSDAFVVMSRIRRQVQKLASEDRYITHGEFMETEGLRNVLLEGERAVRLRELASRMHRLGREGQQPLEQLETSVISVGDEG